MVNIDIIPNTNTDSIEDRNFNLIQFIFQPICLWTVEPWLWILRVVLTSKKRFCFDSNIDHLYFVTNEVCFRCSHINSEHKLRIIFAFDAHILVETYISYKNLLRIVCNYTIMSFNSSFRIVYNYTILSFNSSFFNFVRIKILVENIFYAVCG